MGAGDTASAGSFSVTGNNNVAVVLGSDSASFVGDGNRNLGAALGSALTATAMGGNMTDIVTFLGTL